MDTRATYHLVWLAPNGGSSGAQIGKVMVRWSPDYSDYAEFTRGVDAWYNANNVIASCGSVTTWPAQNLLNPADAQIINNVADGQYWFRIIRQGGNLAMKYSYDGVTYSDALSTISNPLNSNIRFQLSATTWTSVGSYTDYDYVTITSLEPVPEPSSYMLYGTVAAILGLTAWWRKRKLNNRET